MRSGVRKHFFNENYFENIDTEEKAYWLGFISADGSIVKSGKYNSYRLYLNLGYIDEEHLEKFKKSICADDINIQRHTSTKGFCNINGTTTSRIILNSFKMCKDLEKYNVHERKTYDIELPNNIDINLMKHYLRGFFDGDASYSCFYDSKNNRFRYNFDIVTGSRLFAVQLKEFLKSININVNIYNRKNQEHCIRIVSGSKKEILKIIDYCYSDANIYLERKYKKINEIKNIAV